MTPQPLKLVCWIIWAALLMAAGIYLVVLQLKAPSAEHRDDPLGGDTFRSTLLTVAIIQLVLSFGCRFFVTRRLARAGRMQGALASYIVSLALAEACAVDGLVLGFTGRGIESYGIFFVLGVGGLLLQPPTFFEKSSEHSSP